MGGFYAGGGTAVDSLLERSAPALLELLPHSARGLNHYDFVRGVDGIQNHLEACNATAVLSNYDYAAIGADDASSTRVEDFPHPRRRPTTRSRRRGRSSWRPTASRTGS